MSEQKPNKFMGDDEEGEVVARWIEEQLRGKDEEEKFKPEQGRKIKSSPFHKRKIDFKHYK